MVIARKANLSEGDSLALALDNNGDIVLRPTLKRYELSEIVAWITPKNRHREADGASHEAGNAGEGCLRTGSRRMSRCYRSTALLGLPPSFPLALEAVFFALLLDRPPI
jgi:antitoxin component of MazEF toxin-antitoxin module